MSGQGRGAIEVWRPRSSPKPEPSSSERSSFLATAELCLWIERALRRVRTDPRRRMFADTTSAAIDAARTLTQLDHLSRDIWKAWGSGQIADEAQLLAMQLETRRKAVRGEIKPVGIPPGRPSIFPPRRSQRAPVRAVAIARRRRLAASGPMPPALASKFTVSELAVLRIVGDEVRGQGACARTVDEIAARAGTCRTVVKDAIRLAAALGLLTVQERRRQGQKNLPNIVRIVSREWTQWLARGPKSDRPTVSNPTGVGNSPPTANRQRKEGAAYRPQRVFRRGAGQRAEGNG